VEGDEDIYHLPPGGGDPMNLGTVESGGFEQYFQKPTPWVSIRGIERRFDETDVKQALREKRSWMMRRMRSMSLNVS
jgi:hypothetical protein